MKRHYRYNTPARILAESAGLNVEQICKRARIVPEYFEKLARRGNAPDALATRLAAICGCDPRVFLHGLAKHRENEWQMATGAVGTHEAKPRDDAPAPPEGDFAPIRDFEKTFRRRTRPILELAWRKETDA